MQKPLGPPLSGKMPGKSEQYTEYKLRVPRNLVKRYNVLNLKTPRPVKIDDIKEANMVRKTKKQVYIEDEGPSMPSYGAGSVYNFERKEEARRKRRGYIKKEISQQDLPYALRLGGKGGKRYTGRKEPILEHSAYYILTQCPDGVFEAVPVDAWYNFLPDIDYSTLSSDEVEQEFSKRDRSLSYFTKKYTLGVEQGDDGGQPSKVRQKDDDHGLIIHDDYQNDDEEDEIERQEGSDDENTVKKKVTKKTKNLFQGKKKKDAENDSDEEEDDEFQESKEVDYMSESSSGDELVEMDDEPDPENDAKSKAKDDLNMFSDSEDEQEDEKDLNEAGKELKAMLKKESGANGSSDDEEEEEEEEDEDIDKEYSKSAVFMQGKDGKKKKGKPGSNSGSKPNSRSSTPVQGGDQSAETLSQAAKSLKEAGNKRPASPSPQASAKKQKLGSILTGKRDSPHGQKTGSRSGTPSEGATTITEDAIRRYLTHKPMTTTDLMRKFKLKKTLLSKEQTVNIIATILKKIQPDQEKIDGKLYLSIKPKK